MAFDGSGEQPVPSCANIPMIKDELRGKLGFQQHVVGDCGALSNEYKTNDQAWAVNAEDAAAKSMAATTDLECEGADGPTSVYGNVTLSNALRDQRISMGQIDAALTRLYSSRMALGLLDFPSGMNVFDQLDRDTVVESVAHRELALTAAIESFVLLKNEGETLPLTKKQLGGSKLCVFGPRANVTAIGSYANDGVLARYNQTFLGGIMQRFGPEKVVFTPGCEADTGACTLECATPDTTAIVRALAQCSASVVVTGTVTNGEFGTPPHCGADSIHYEAEGSDRPNTSLPALALLKAVATAAETTVAATPHKIVLLLANAGSVELAWPKASPQIGSILHSSFPGQAAGRAAASVLAGDAVPAGRLALTYYDRLEASLPSISNYSMANRTYRYLTPDVAVAYSFGFGHSGWGSGFQYSNATLSPARSLKIGPQMEMTVAFTITNRGNVTSDEVVQLYLRTETTSGPQTPRPELKAFRRVKAIKPGEQRETTLSLGWRELSVLRGSDLERVVEASSRTLLVGGGQPHEFVGGVSATFETVV